MRVAHRTSDELHQAMAEIERLKAARPDPQELKLRIRELETAVHIDSLDDIINGDETQKARAALYKALGIE